MAESEHVPASLKRAFHINSFMQKRIVFMITLLIVIYCTIGLLMRIALSEYAAGIIFTSSADVFFTISGLLSFFPATCAAHPLSFVPIDSSAYAPQRLPLSIVPL